MPTGVWFYLRKALFCEPSEICYIRQVIILSLSIWFIFISNLLIAGRPHSNRRRTYPVLRDLKVTTVGKMCFIFR
jgi:hypothetical protein